MEALRISMNVPHDAVRVCPSCGAQVLRTHRHLGDRIVSLLMAVHRYRCTAPACAWEGVISVRDEAATRGEAALRAWVVRILWMLLGIAIALAGVGGLRWMRAPPAPKPVPVAAAAPASVALPVPVEMGESFDGIELPEGDLRTPPAPVDLTLRRACAWGVPGRNPYKGTVTDALAGAGLPDDVVRKIDAMVERKFVSDRVEIRRGAIQTTSGRRQFEPNITAMGFGKTLCFGTKVNFRPGHVEYADLYEATDTHGTRFSVMVPYVCGNVAVLAERAERTPDNGRGIPEPGTLACVAAAGLAWLASRRRPARARHGERP